MHYFDELRDNADKHFAEWLRALAEGSPAARAAAWGLRLDLGGLDPADALVRVAEGMERYAGHHRVLYAAAVAGGPYDDGDAIESMMEAVEAILADRALPKIAHEVNPVARIVRRIRRGDWSEVDVTWLEERAATMSDSLVLRMTPFDGEPIKEISRHVARASTPQVDHWTRREIPAGARHLVLRESLRGRVTKRGTASFRPTSTSSPATGRDGASGAMRRVYRPGLLTTY